MKLLIVGPVAPFRGGIARHTTALARELWSDPGRSLSIISFSRQYPRLLYPGQSDRDPGLTAPSEVDVSFSLDTVNPATWRRAAERALQERPDLAILPAWTFFVAPALGHVARALRRRGVPVVTLVHNAEDHEAAGWKARLLDLQLRQSSRFVTHNEGMAGALRRRFPGIPTTVSPHPLYDDYPPAKGILPRRAGLELLFFGLVRPYKGLEVLLRALALAKNRDVHLSVVGEFWSGRSETEALIAELGIGERVEVVPRYVADAEAAEFFHRCDAVVAPYLSASGSGVLALAQNYRKPVIASDIPGLADAVGHGKTGWLFPAADAAALAALIDTAVSRESAAQMQPQLELLTHRLSWNAFARAVLAQPQV